MKDQDLKKTVEYKDDPVQLLIETREKYKVIVQSLHTEVETLKAKMNQDREKRITDIVEKSGVADKGVRKILRENELLKDKIHEYKMIYGMEAPANDELIRDLVDKIHDCYIVLAERSSGATMGCMKRACIDLRTYAMALIGAFNCSEIARDEVVSLILKRNKREE